MAMHASLNECLDGIREQVDLQQDYIIVPADEYSSFKTEIEDHLRDANEKLVEAGIRYAILPKNERNFEFLIIAEKVVAPKPTAAPAAPAAPAVPATRLFRLEQVMLPARKYLNVQDCQTGIAVQLAKKAEYIIVNHQDYNWWAQPLQEYLLVEAKKLEESYVPCAETFSLMGRDFIIIGKKADLASSARTTTLISVIDEISTAMIARQPLLYTEDQYYTLYKKEIIDAIYAHNRVYPASRYGITETETLVIGGKNYTRFAKLHPSESVTTEHAPRCGSLFDREAYRRHHYPVMPDVQPLAPSASSPNPLNLLEEVRVDETVLSRIYNSILKFAQENEPIMLWKTEWDRFPSEIIDYIEENCPSYRILENPASIAVHGAASLIVAEPPFPESSAVNTGPESEYEVASQAMESHLIDANTEVKTIGPAPETTTALVKVEEDINKRFRDAVLDLVITLVKDDPNKKHSVKELIKGLATASNNLLHFLRDASIEQLDFFVRSLDLTPARKEENKDALCAAWLEVRNCLETLNPSPKNDAPQTTEPEFYHCPVCGWLGLTGEPNYSFEVCSCCGVEIGQDNADGLPADNFLLRQEWLLRGAHWFKPAQKPDGWETNPLENGIKQLQAAKLPIPGDPNDPLSKTRFCEAEITVYGVEGSESNGIELVLEEHWNLDAISVPWASRRKEDIIVYIGQDFLRGGESEADLADRLQIAIWSHLGRYTPVTIETTLLEELPSSKFLAKPDLYKTYFGVANERCPIPRLTVPPIPTEEPKTEQKTEPAAPESEGQKNNVQYML